MTTVDLHALAPVFVLGGTLVVGALATASSRPGRLAGVVVAAGSAGALVPIGTLVAVGHRRALYHGRFVVDPTALVIDAVVVLVAYVASVTSIRRGSRTEAAWPVLVAIATLGGVVAASARDGLWLVVALETVAVPLTFLLVLQTGRWSADRLLRVHALGAVALAVEAYGLSLVWVATATTELGPVGHRLARRGGLAVVGLVVLGLGLAARVVAVGKAIQRKAPH